MRVIRAEPARILWYVSESREGGTKAIRAASLLDEVAVDSARVLFRRFRRLGVYRWSQVLETARAPESPLMAIRFSHTELLERPIPWNRVQALLVEHRGKRNQLQGPLRIDPDLYFALHEAGQAGADD